MRMQFTRSLPMDFTCTECNFYSGNKKDYMRHLTTAKHTTRTTRIDFTPSNTASFVCICGKEYKYKRGLWKHQKTCTYQPQIAENVNHVNVETTTDVSNQLDPMLLVELLKQNQDFKDMMIEQNKKMTEQHETIIELSQNSVSTTHNTIITNNTTNNKFNLNVFLNETCKDAVNLNDFIQSIQLTSRDFVNTGEVGYVKGISSIMIDRIRDMEPHARPIHCTDLKRETVYVKDSNVWAKEDDNKTHLRKAVRIVANKNKDQVHPWRQQNPNYEILDTPECDKFFEYTKVSLGGYGREEYDKFETKIINNILKETMVDKNMVCKLSSNSIKKSIKEMGEPNKKGQK